MNTSHSTVVYTHIAHVVLHRPTCTLHSTCL